MLPLLPFVTGVAAGAFALKLWRNNRPKPKLNKPQDTLPVAAPASLDIAAPLPAPVVRKRRSPAKVVDAVAVVKPVRQPRAKKPAVAKSTTRAPEVRA